MDVLKWDHIVTFRIFDFAFYTSLRIKREVLFAFYFARYTWLDFALSQFRTSHFINAPALIVHSKLAYCNFLHNSLLKYQINRLHWIVLPLESAPSSFRQPHSIHCPARSPHSAHITSSQSPPSQVRSHHLSPPSVPFIPDLKLISFTDPFLHSHSESFRTAFMDYLSVRIFREFYGISGNNS